MHEHTSKYADFLVKIDIDRKIESLNISNSAAIVFHHLSKKDSVILFIQTPTRTRQIQLKD